VKPAPFRYLAPRSVEEAAAALAEHGDDAKVLAGGQSLVPMLNFRLARPAVLVDINRVAGLEGLVERDGLLHVGALVRQRRLERWAAGRAPLLAAALHHVGHAAIRNRGTVAGSVVHADPAAELPALLLCLDGTVIARGAGGVRTIPAADLFLGPLMTALGPDEVVVETRWALPPVEAGWGFHEVARRHGDFALVGAAAVVTVRDDGRIDRVRLALFGCGPTPVRAEAAEKALAGQVPTPEMIDDAARRAGEALDPQDDLHATAAYRRRVGGTLLGRAIRDAVERARGAGR
jgi:carbon-monoxide dehydrogenase medium subunit